MTTDNDRNQSILSKKWKSDKQKQQKRMRHESNTQHRAALHREKANTGSSTTAATIQSKIDAISEGKHL
jgi:hypothetical protein